MFSRKRRSDQLPGLAAVRVQSFGWPKVGQDEQRCLWRQDGDALSLNYFPERPTVYRPVGDDRRLAEYCEDHARAGGAALVEARWIAAPDGTPITWSISKARQGETGVWYVGALIVPFANCSWVVRLESYEGSPTGMREAVWVAKYLAGGGNPEVVMQDESTRSTDEPPPLRRKPSDDEEWDGLIPSHPLSRVRQLLPQLVASIQISPAAHRLPAFADS